jgi:hypothetical protein
LIGLPFLVLVVDGFLFLVAAAIPAMVLVDACAHLPLPYHVFFFMCLPQRHASCTL